MGIEHHWTLEQGTEEWFKARLGLLTASEMKNIVTASTLKVADNKDTRAHVYEIAAQRLNQYVEPSFQSYDMARGKQEELYAAELYDANTDQTVGLCGFITNDRWGFKVGFSPDALVGDDGLIEIKSRNQKYQTQTIIEDVVPKEFMLQIQSGLLVSERKWCDFVSYSNGMPMFTKRVYPDADIHSALVDAAQKFEDQVQAKMEVFKKNAKGLPVAERREPEGSDDIKPSHSGTDYLEAG